MEFISTLTKEHGLLELSELQVIPVWMLALLLTRKWYLLHHPRAIIIVVITYKAMMYVTYTVLLNLNFQHDPTWMEIRYSGILS